ncbi:MAG: hypothetical protein DRI34_03830 [Deltaproteobacteria bacterium]|nr:MAG: hypothetical protein DRI34_03830 [Deltaproteobacteria bacterium]
MTGRAKNGEIPAGLLAGLGGALRDAVVLTLVASALGLLVNLFHPRRIPYLAEKEYQTLVPCPVPGGEVTPCQPGDEMVRAADSLPVDARSPAQYASWHLEGAINIPFDYLEPVPQKLLDELNLRLNRRRARRLVVYGDGKNPDSGEQLGRELSGKGFRNVFFVSGGAPALREGTAAPRPEDARHE